MASKKYSKERMLEVVPISTSWSNLLFNLDLKVTGGSHRHIQNIVNDYGIPTTHFTGQGWSKGLTKESNDGVAKVTKANTIPDAEVFVKNSTYPGSKLKNRLLKRGWVYKCGNDKCNISEWLGKPITLHVDHINGIHNDNRLINLRFLCPNCHQQTETWGCKK